LLVRLESRFGARERRLDLRAEGFALRELLFDVGAIALTTADFWHLGFVMI